MVNPQIKPGKVSSFELLNICTWEFRLPALKWFQIVPGKHRKRDVATVFAYSHLNTPIDQWECAYCLKYFIKCNRYFLAKRGVMVPGVPCVDRGNWGQDLALGEYSVLRRIFWQESGLILWCHIQRCRSFSEGVGPRIIVLESQPGKQSSRLKRSREITTEPIAEWVKSTKILTKK